MVVRGIQVGGSGHVYFDLIDRPVGNFNIPRVPTVALEDSVFNTELLLPLPTKHYPGEAFASYIAVDKPGCYVLQFDGVDFAFQTTFRVSGAN